MTRDNSLNRIPRVVNWRKITSIFNKNFKEGSKNSILIILKASDFSHKAWNLLNPTHQLTPPLYLLLQRGKEVILLSKGLQVWKVKPIYKDLIVTISCLMVWGSTSSTPHSIRVQKWLHINLLMDFQMCFSQEILINCNKCITTNQLMNSIYKKKSKIQISLKKEKMI